MQVAQHLDTAKRRAYRVAHFRFVERAAGQFLLGGVEPHWRIGGGAQADGDAAALAVAVERDLRRRRHESEVATPRIHLVKAGADRLPLPDGKAHACQAGAIRQAVGHQPGEEFARRQLSVGAASAIGHRGVERDRDQRQFRRRVGMGERAAHGAARARRGMADERYGALEQGQAPGHQRVALDRALPRAGADSDAVAVLAHIG
ncbi:MAG: hypothetical protein P8Y71_30225 [Pseudolabrys sp.]